MSPTLGLGFGLSVQTSNQSTLKLTQLRTLYKSIRSVKRFFLVEDTVLTRTWSGFNAVSVERLTKVEQRIGE